ncbi:PASTA domain-containing protein [Granulicella arctica]|uniref:PASTA domain-containing protein n=1 Tax=Granulicella arctica TaxID=940613 RepID=UPI0021E06CDA|nr:PASTA domain-containing protein [Granulicella arctica]
MSVRIPITKVNRFFNIIFGAAAMIAIALVFAFTTMRLAIHGGQVEVPNLVGQTASDAQKTVGNRGLNLVLTSRFYSTTVPAGHIISQTPSPGVIVRHEWEIRAIESLGPQQVEVPDVSGMTERPAAMAIRKLSLDLGTVAHLPAPGDPGTVLAQTPPPNAGGIDSPRVSLLLSQKDDGHSTAFVMPAVTGLTRETASTRLAALGLYMIVAPSPDAATPGTTPSGDAMVVGDPGGPVTSQSPAAGHRVVRGEGVKLTFGGS